MAAAALTGSAQTLTLDKTNAIKAPARQDVPAMVSSRADDGYTLRFCNSIYSWYGLGKAGTYVQYITIPAEIATQLAGNKVTSISFSICLGTSDASKTAVGTVFVTENPDVTNLTDLTYKAAAPVTIRNSYLVDPGYQTAPFTSGQEYVIKENTPFSFGVMYSCAATDYPVGIDGYNAGQFAGTVALYQNGSRVYNLPMVTEFGTNLMMYAVTKGEKTELLDMFTILGANFDGYMLPIYSSVSNSAAHIAVDNYGTNALKSVNYSYKFNDGEYTDADAAISIDGGTAMWVTLPIENLPAGHNDVTVRINKVNGNVISPVEAKLQYISLEGAEPYDRAFVVEEFTGTWCGYCPRGIVGMEYMQETYPEKFIGIAVHASSGSSSDKFQVANYLPFINEYASNFPSCIINRDPQYVPDPSKEELEQNYGYWLDQVSPAKIVVDYEVVEKEVVLHAGVEFSINDNHAYNLAFVLTEDGLTGYQTNYYAGGSKGKMDGWEDKASKVSWTYTHTAIRIDNAFGLQLAESVEANYSYMGFASFPYIGAMNKKQFDLDNTHAIALLFDAETGVIVNAAKIDLASPTDGIDDAISMPEVPAEYYNIQGQKVANPRSGQLYIRVQGDKATKVVY